MLYSNPRCVDCIVLMRISYMSHKHILIVVKDAVKIRDCVIYSMSMHMKYIINNFTILMEYLGNNFPRVRSFIQL